MRISYTSNVQDISNMIFVNYPVVEVVLLMQHKYGLYRFIHDLVYSAAVK